MDEKAVEAVVERVLDSKLAPIVAFVNESKAAKAQDAQAKVDAEALDAAAAEAVSAYEEKVAAIEAAELLEPIAEGLKARARKGEDITSAIESAKADNEKILEAAQARIQEADDDTVFGRIREGAESSATYTFPKGW